MTEKYEKFLEKLMIDYENLKVTLLSDVYIDASTLMLFKCDECNDEFEAIWDNLKQRKIGCKKCSNKNHMQDRKFT